jgi:hypothetical protein
LRILRVAEPVGALVVEGHRAVIVVNNTAVVLTVRIRSYNWSLIIWKDLRFASSVFFALQPFYFRRDPFGIGFSGGNDMLSPFNSASFKLSVAETIRLVAELEILSFSATKLSFSS